MKAVDIWSKSPYPANVLSNHHSRKHGGNIVAVWCNADQFARAEGLHELFTGMLDSDESEALLYRVETSQEERDCENVKLAMG